MKNFWMRQIIILKDSNRVKNKNPLAKPEDFYFICNYLNTLKVIIIKSIVVLL